MNSVGTVIDAMRNALDSWWEKRFAVFLLASWLADLH